MISDRIDCLANYTIVNYKKLICYYEGIIYKAGFKVGNESIFELLAGYDLDQSINLNNFYGSYRIVIEDATKNIIIFFGDNSGSCCFYYDISTVLFSDSFLKITKQSNNLLPNFDAITEFLSFNCVYSDDTICKGIFKTNPFKYYVIEGNRISEREKDILGVDKSSKYSNLSDFIDDFTHASEGIKKAVVITGGTDSRTILSHVISKNENFYLFISGREELEDVKIAKEISEVLGKNLYISDEKMDNINEEELRRLFIRTDGVYSYFSRFRLHKKSDMLEKLGVELELGGVAGELYKNSFLNQDFPFYTFGGVDRDKFYRMKINPEYLDLNIFTDKIKNAQSSMKTRVLNKLFVDTSDKKHQTYFKAGIRALQYRMCTITNSSSFTVPIISPFAEIDVMALPYNEKPWNLELNKWQRREVSKYCPVIASIKTDRGTTLAHKKLSLIKEILGTYIYLFCIGVSRLLGFKKTTTNSNRNAEFDKLRKMKLFDNAISFCKELGILEKYVVGGNIPVEIADKLLTIAMVFGFDRVFSDIEKQ